MKWTYTQPPGEVVRHYRQALGLSESGAVLLSRLELSGSGPAERFLRPRLAHLSDPFEMGGMAAAVERLHRALRRGERVFVFGDYDVDGVTSTTLLVEGLRTFGLFPEYFVPLRLDEGYGLSEAAVGRVLERGVPDLFVALDCGTNARGQIARLRGEGSEVLVIDHHRAKAAPLAEAILVNPHVNDAADAPWRHLCTVGLVFKVLHGLVKRLREEGDEVARRIRLKDFLDLVAMGTVADLVPLTGENRILTRFGLKRLMQSQRPGMVALLDACGIDLGVTITPADISFKLGPRINASGRLADASVPIEMLLGQDYEVCHEAAADLDRMNTERRAIEAGVSEEAVAQASGLPEDAAGVVVYGEGWHPGVVGIVAGKLCRELGKPAIVLGHEGDGAKGSGRSVPGVNLVEVLGECADLLTSWGGHPMAVGVSLPPEAVPAFRERFAEAVGGAAGGAGPVEPVLPIDLWVKATALDERLLEELALLHPFGEGNPEPVIGVRGVSLLSEPEAFGQGHCRFQIPVRGRRRIGAVAWRMAGRMPPAGKPLDLAGRFGWNRWNGREYPQFELLDWRLAEG